MTRDTTKSPYKGLHPRQFWRPAVAESHVLSTNNFWYKKYDITLEDRIASAGSCFAQHISRRLIEAGYNFLDLEPPPPNSCPVKNTLFLGIQSILHVMVIFILPHSCLSWLKNLWD